LIDPLANLCPANGIAKGDTLQLAEQNNYALILATTLHYHRNFALKNEP
jgi:hypothetical protein